MALPIRVQTNAERSRARPPLRELRLDPEQHTGGLPWLHGELEAAAPKPLVLLLRVHNRAGIPLVEGHCQVRAGQRQVTFRDLRPLGIEAYAHKPEAQRIEVAQRIWSRRAYASLAVVANA
ncbi:MAG: hypothetical protein ACRDH2_18785 [Anaerolineales bacterium]